MTIYTKDWQVCVCAHTRVKERGRNRKPKSFFPSCHSHTFSTPAKQFLVYLQIEPKPNWTFPLHHTSNQPPSFYSRHLSLSIQPSSLYPTSKEKRPPFATVYSFCFRLVVSFLVFECKRDSWEGSNQSVGFHIFIDSFIHSFSFVTLFRSINLLLLNSCSESNCACQRYQSCLN